MEKAELKELLRESTEKVLFELGKVLDKNSDPYNELIILWKRHDDIEREIRLGTIGFDEASRENIRVTNSLLKLIDKLEKSNEVNIINKTEKKEIPIEEAIEWFSNALIDKGSFNEYKYKNKRHFVNRCIKKIDVSNKGDFLLCELYEDDYYRSNPDEYKPYHASKTTIYISGRFQDISNVTIEIDENMEDIFWVACRATNYKNIFHTAYNELTVSEKGKIEENSDGHDNEFRLAFDNHDFALKVKNAIDYLAIHFGRKEDAF